MIFRDDTQQARTCRAVLGSGYRNRHGLIPNTGPTSAFWELVEGNPPVSSGEKCLLGIAAALWTGSGGPTFGDLLRLDNPNLTRVGQLLAILGGTDELALMRWLAEYGS